MRLPARDAWTIARHSFLCPLVVARAKHSNTQGQRKKIGVKRSGKFANAGTHDSAQILPEGLIAGHVHGRCPAVRQADDNGEIWSPVPSTGPTLPHSAHEISV
jgi:hypothetical protein